MTAAITRTEPLWCVYLVELALQLQLLGICITLSISQWTFSHPGLGTLHWEKATGLAKAMLHLSPEAPSVQTDGCVK